MITQLIILSLLITILAIAGIKYQTKRNFGMKATCHSDRVKAITACCLPIINIGLLLGCIYNISKYNSTFSLRRILKNIFN